MLRRPRSPRFWSESRNLGPRNLRPHFAWLALLLLMSGFATLATVATAAESGAQSDLGSRIHERFRVWDEDDSIRLKPVESDSAIRSIELADDESEVSVNGKAFSAEELRAFLGKDGDLLAELAALDAEERRAALGLSHDDEEAPAEKGDELVPPVPPMPPVPGMGHIRIETDNDDRVSFGRSIEVAAGESAGDVVCIGCSITVAGEVQGDAVSVGGSVRLESGAHVQGNTVSVGGRVKLASGAMVEGDAVAVGGTVQLEEGATVEGQKSTVGWGDGISGDGHKDWRVGWPDMFNTDFGDFFWSVVRALFLILLCCLSVLLARGSLERTSRRLMDEPWKAIFAGLLTQLLFFPVLIFVTVILAVSIIGIPLLVLVPVAVLALLVSTLLGFAAVAQSLGRWAAGPIGWRLTEPLMPVIVGVGMIQGVTILAKFLGMPGGFFGVFAFVLMALGFFIKYATWTMGLGAMTLSLLGRDWRRPHSPLADSGSSEIPAGRSLEPSSPSEPSDRSDRSDRSERSEPPPPPPGAAATSPMDEDTDAEWGSNAETAAGNEPPPDDKPGA